MPSFDKLAHIYDSTRSLPVSVMQNVVSCVEGVLKEFDCNSVIDVGVGTGRFASPISLIGFEVVGIDISKEMMKVAKGKKLDKLIFADANFLPFPNLSFDAALAVHILHLTNDWNLVLNEICRVTKKVLIGSGTDVDGVSLLWRYHELRKEIDQSFAEQGLAGGENTLSEIIPTLKTIVVVEENESLDADKEILFLESRSSSVSLETAGDIHQGIIEALRSEFAGKTLRRARKELVYVWSIHDLSGAKRRSLPQGR